MQEELAGALNACSSHTKAMLWPIRDSPMVQSILMGVLDDVGGDHSTFAEKCQKPELEAMLSRLQNQVGKPGES